jgi:hypothetical protein
MIQFCLNGPENDLTRSAVEHQFCFRFLKSGLHCWQLAGKTNVCGIFGATGSPAYYSLAPQVLTGLMTPSRSWY